MKIALLVVIILTTMGVANKSILKKSQDCDEAAIAK
jgi:hypothetical protein